MLQPETPTIISQRILAGERPSVVLRSLLATSSETTKYDLAHELAAAFPNQDHWLLIHPVWHWKEREKSELRDALFDFRLICELVGLGEPLPWSAGECKQELERIQPGINELKRPAQLKADKESSFDSLVAKISGLSGKVACIEALWDGDTNGWFVRMSAIMLDGAAHREHFLACVSKGGDIRLFNGQVPPWPEALHATDVGDQLAKHYGVEFYFPSPESPDDQQPSWLQRNS